MNEYLHLFILLFKLTLYYIINKEYILNYINNNNMHKLVNSFIEYLLNIGILAHDSLQKFNAVNIKDNNETPTSMINNFKQNMTTSLMNFIYSINDNSERLIIMSNIVNKYITNTSQYCKQKLKTAILLCDSHKPKNYYCLQGCFYNWQSKTRHSHITRLLSSSTPHKTHHHFRSYNHSHSHSAHIIKPSKTTTNIHNNNNNINTTHTTNYYTLTSFPNPLSQSFHERQNSFIHKKKQTLTISQKEKENSLSRLCTFQPIITHDDIYYKQKSSSNSPIHIRLFKDYKARKNKHLSLQNNINSTIKYNANRGLIGVDYSKIERLYKEYKEKRLYKQNLTKVIDYQNGITYQPFVPHDKYYKRINTSFYERECQHLYNKEKLKQDNDERFRKRITLGQVGYDRISQHNKNKIRDEVLVRLYSGKSDKKRNKELYGSGSRFKTEEHVSLDGNSNAHNGSSTLITQGNFNYVSGNNNNESYSMISGNTCLKGGFSFSTLETKNLMLDKE